MGAKETAARAVGLLVLSPLLLAGCATAKRLAPPGFVKYEDLAKGRPPSEAIVARIKESQSKGGGRFPNLSQQPLTQPVPPPPADQAVVLAALAEAGFALDTEIAADRAAVSAEQAQGFATAADAAALAAALKTQLDADRAAAAADKAQR